MNTVFIIAACVVYAFFTVCLALVFKNAGEGWWKALIPVDNIKTLFKVMYDNDMFWGYIMTGGFLAFLGLAVAKFKLEDVLPAFTFSNTEQLVVALLLIGGILLAILFNVLISLRGAKRFGKSVGFAVGLILLPIVFYAILAFTKPSYNSEL